jgi:hypothetical protein
LGGLICRAVIAWSIPDCLFFINPCFILIRMHFFYVDESGSVADPKQIFFVLAGVTVFERQVHRVGKELDKIAARFNPGDPDAIAFAYGMAIYFAYGAGFFCHSPPKADTETQFLKVFDSWPLAQ